VTNVVRRESRVVGVETTAGRIDAGAVVVAAGAWAPRLCREMGLTLPARSKALDTVLVTGPHDLADPHMIFIDNVQGSYFRPESGILTIVGVPCQDWDVDPDTMSTGLPSHAPHDGAQILTRRIPAMERATLARGFRAFDCYSHDRHAILGVVANARDAPCRTRHHPRSSRARQRSGDHAHLRHVDRGIQPSGTVAHPRRRRSPDPLR
jgi:sarcosine oxidase subunit beta